MFLWMEGLEKALPGFHENKSPTPTSKEKETQKQKPKLNVTNTILKIVIDQTLGAVWNTILFISTLGLLRGNDYDQIVNQIRTVRCPLRPTYLIISVYVVLCM